MTAGTISTLPRPHVAVVAAVNDDRVLADNLAKSPMIVSGRVPLITERGYDSAGKAYNAGARQTDAELIVFAHQDVFFPRGWLDKLLAAVQALDILDRPWAVLGVWGVRGNGRCCGRVWCTGSGQEFSGAILPPVEAVASIDEIVIVFNRASNLGFDEQLPGFHLYATDIVLQARQRGFSSFVFDGPVVHNSRTVPQLNRDYANAYRFMQRKWRTQSPIQTCVLPVTRHGWPLKKYRAKVRAEPPPWASAVALATSVAK